MTPPNAFGSHVSDIIYTILHDASPSSLALSSSPFLSFPNFLHCHCNHPHPNASRSPLNPPNLLTHPDPTPTSTPALSLLPRQPLLPQLQPPLPQSLQLHSHLLAFKRYLVCLFGFWPEIWDGEALVQVCAEVVHPADGEEDVETEL